MGKSSNVCFNTINFVDTENKIKALEDFLLSRRRFFPGECEDIYVKDVKECDDLQPIGRYFRRF